MNIWLKDIGVHRKTKQGRLFENSAIVGGRNIIGPGFIFQQDDYPKHSSKQVKYLFALIVTRIKLCSARHLIELKPANVFKSPNAKNFVMCVELRIYILATIARAAIAKSDNCNKNFRLIIVLSQGQQPTPNIRGSRTFPSQACIQLLKSLMQLWPRCFTVFSQDLRGSNTMNLDRLVLIITNLLAANVQTALYRFVAENDDYLTKCVDQPEVGTIDDFFDLSGLEVFFDDEGLHVNGSYVAVWDVKSTDRVALYAELRQLVRNSWQPTPFSMQVFNLCEAMMDVNSLVYQFWTKNLFPEDRQCLAKGVRYREIAHSVQMEFEALVNIEGRYKVVTRVSKNTGLEPRVICTEFRGEILKVKN
uniref:Uncharacterized protein n=1 Tax=Glossina palpalis gambiensis TaxID=67801 RepID=A0A1B0BPH0_9MUSC